MNAYPDLPLPFALDPPVFDRGRRLLKKTLSSVVVLLALAVVRLGAEPIKLHPDNPHYYLFKGRPTILVTSAEHYGAVVNKDFDYVAYLDALKSYRLNYTRIYPGFLFEPVDKFIKHNTLGPKPEGLILPWARSQQPGYVLGGNRFDLDRWDPAYFNRLKDFIKKAAKRGVVVEICDEPFLTGTPISLAGPWLNHLVEVVKQTERALPKKHLIAQQVEGPMGGPCDLSAHPDVSIIVAQYVWEASAEQMGGMKALDFEYGHNKPIEFNETYYYPIWYKGDAVGASRVEAWEFIVGGGASFNHLNGQYTVQNPRGDTPDNAQVLRALKNLMDFMSHFDFIKMRPDRSFIVSGVPAGAWCRGLSQPGKQYALYLHHSVRGKDGPASEPAVYVVSPGSYAENFVLDLPAGTYQADWVDPASGSVVRIEKVTHGGGHRTFTTPNHPIDIALRIKRF